jgi:hypothetical protein
MIYRSQKLVNYLVKFEGIWRVVEGYQDKIGNLKFILNGKEFIEIFQPGNNTFTRLDKLSDVVNFNIWELKHRH